MSALIFSGFLKSFVTMFFGAAIVKMLYGINIFAIGFIIIPLALLLFISGLAIGLTAAAMIIY